MTAIVEPVARRETRAMWIASARFDLILFILSPLAGLALLLAYPIGGPVLGLLVAGLVGGPHYIATYSFYFWDDTAGHRRERWAAYFLGPLAIAAGVGVVVLLRMPVLIALLIYFWNAWHVSRQSCGILSIYRGRAGAAPHRFDRTAANVAILTVSFAMALSHPGWYPVLDHALQRVWPPLPQVLPLALAIVAGAAIVMLAWSLFRRHREGRPASAAELAFLGSSLVMFHPYLWVRDADLATLGMLFGHFLQYLGIVWLVNMRKSAEPGGSLGQRAVTRLWREPKYLFPALLLIGALFLLVQISIMAVTIALVLIHFYLDGLFWAFSRPEIRRSLGSLLLAPRPAS